MNDVQDPRTPSRAEQAKTSPSLGRGSAVTWSLIAGLGIVGMAIAYWLIFVGKVTASWAVAATVPIASRSHHRAISTREKVEVLQTMTRDSLPSQKRTACVICGYPISPDRLSDRDMPQTCGDPECDHRAMGVDIFDVARRVGATLPIPSKPPAQS